jgi:putative endonuclease
MLRARAGGLHPPLAVIRRWLRILFARPHAPRDPLGRAAEDAAARYLAAHGYRLLGRNLRLAFGEVDILAEDPDGSTIVLVEVKSRRADPARALPPPEAAVTTRKSRRLVALAAALRRLNRWNDRPIRIDVVAIDFEPDGGASLRHHLHAVHARR